MWFFICISLKLDINGSIFNGFTLPDLLAVYISLKLDINSCPSKFLLRIHSNPQICRSQDFLLNLTNAFVNFSKNPIRSGFMSSVDPPMLLAYLLLAHYSNKIAVFTAFSYVPPIILAKDSLYSKTIYQKSPAHFFL